MCREQKIPKGSCPNQYRPEAEGDSGARSMSSRDVKGKNGGDLLKRVVSYENMVQAYRQVRKNRRHDGRRPENVSERTL